MTQQTTHLWGQIEEWLNGLDFAPSQSRLAERVGVARSAVSAWKFGKAYPTPENLAELARVIDSANAAAAYERLLDATLRDQGYVPMPEEGGGAHAGSAAPNTPADSGPHLLAVASGDEGDEKLAREATEAARKARQEQLDAIEEMKRKRTQKGE